MSVRSHDVAPLRPRIGSREAHARVARPLRAAAPIVDDQHRALHLRLDGRVGDLPLDDERLADVRGRLRGDRVEAGGGDPSSVFAHAASESTRFTVSFAMRGAYDADDVRTSTGTSPTAGAATVWVNTPSAVGCTATPFTVTCALL